MTYVHWLFQLKRRWQQYEQRSTKTTTRVAGYEGQSACNPDAPALTHLAMYPAAVHKRRCSSILHVDRASDKTTAFLNARQMQLFVPLKACVCSPNNVFTIGVGNPVVLRPTGKSFTPLRRLGLVLYWFAPRQMWPGPVFFIPLRREGFLIPERWCPAHCRWLMWLANSWSHGLVLKRFRLGLPDWVSQGG